MNKFRDNGNAVSVPTVIGRVNQGILVLGMHRSGTSACTRVLNMLGCALSDQLIGVGKGNENGHWEALAAVNLNEEILASAGSSHEDWGSINPDWRDSAIRSQMVERASAVIKEHARLGPLFALKDPRMCRLGDVWIEAAKAADVDPLVFVMLRNPLEVTGSLEARDLMVTGYAELLWLRHVLDAEHFSRGNTRVFFRYDQLLSNWQGLITKCKDGLGVALPRNSPKVHAEISQFLSQSHRHHHADPAMTLNDPTRSPWLREAFEIMLRWSESGEDAADYTALNEMRAELDRSYGVFARLLLSEEMTGEVASGKRLRDQIGLLEQEGVHQAEALRAATETAEGERAAAQHRETELAAALDQAQTIVAEVQADIAAEQLERQAAENRHAEALSELQDQHLRNAELTGQLASLQSAVIQRQEELAQLLAQFREAEALRLRAQFEGEREREQRLALEQSIAAAKQQAEASTSDLAELTLMLNAQTAAAEAAQAASLAEAQRLSEQILQLTDAANAAEAARTASERKLTARFDELARLTAILSEESRRAEASDTQSQWLRDVRRLEEGFPAWWAIMPAAWRQRDTHRRYARAGLFDAAAYLALYPDIAAQGMDPVRHYILHGMAEGRTRPVPF